MTSSEHRLEAERLHREANELQRYEDARRRLYCVTMAHAKRLQAQWHERRSSWFALENYKTHNGWPEWPPDDLRIMIEMQTEKFFEDLKNISHRIAKEFPS